MCEDEGLGPRQGKSRGPSVPTRRWPWRAGINALVSEGGGPETSKRETGPLLPEQLQDVLGVGIGDR